MKTLPGGRSRGRISFTWPIDMLLLAAIAIGSFAVYTSNGQTLASYDSAPNSLLVFNAVENRRLDFDRFRHSYFTSLGGGYAFAEAPSGHLASVFPVGAALVTLPIYAIFSIGRQSTGDLPAITSPAFETLRQGYEKTAAAVVAALSVVLFVLCAREIGGVVPTTVATLVYALGTSIWSIGSQALWQHGPVNLIVLAMAYSLVRARRAERPARATVWLFAAGLCAGLLPVIRPTAGLFAIAGFVFVVTTFRARGVPFVIGLALGVAPGLAWNLYFFHSLLGGYAGYAGVVPAYIFSPARALTAFAALMLSPSRGILIFSPVLVFALFGAVGLRRVRDPNARLVKYLAIACAATVAQYAFFNTWWGGYAYGPRYLTDIDAVATLLLVYVVPSNPLTFVRSSTSAALTATLFGLLFVISVVVQFVGLNSGAAGSEWNAVPISVDTEPGRVWRISDNQIERNVRAAYFRFFAWNRTASSGYEPGLAAHVATVSPTLAHVAKGASIDALAVLSNDGSSRIYGYDTGLYIGQMRIRVRIVDAQGRVTSEQYLYVSGSPAAGERTTAIGTLRMPAEPGTYLLECDPVLVGAGAVHGPTVPFRITMHVS